jgi:uncharacterized membrane protein
MSEELAAFTAALDAVGQPWSRLGLRMIGVGLIMLLVVQLSFAAGKVAIFLSDLVPNLFNILAILAVLLIFAGWSLLIVAFFKRRRWRKTQALDMPPLSTP